MSTVHFDTQERHIEVRARLVIEGVTNRNSYITDTCLACGAWYQHSNANLPKVFVTYSDYYTPGQKVTSGTVDDVYSLELMNIT